MLTAEKTASLAEEIRTEIENKKIQVPTLPEVALQVREAVESNNVGADAVARIIAQDAAMAARLLQVANSPLYPGNHNIDSLSHAVARLGLRLVRSLVISLAMKQLFQANSPALGRQFRKIWDDTLQVAAISRVLADRVPQLENEQAMLGGLIHNIGALPILMKIDQYCGLKVEESFVTDLIEHAGPYIGAHIMEHWHFTDSLANIPTACHDLSYDPGPAPTYADIVLVARLQHLSFTAGPGALLDWSRVPAFSKIGMEPEEIVLSMEEPAGKIAEVRRVLES